MEKCIFCEIVAKRIPSSIVYEDEYFAAILDINPLNPGHTLVVPKQHLRWTYDVEKFGDFWEVAKAAALAAVEALGAKFVNFMTMGFAVEHAHIHVVPRFENDGHAELPNRENVKQIPKEEMVQIAEKLKAAIAKHPPKKSTAALTAEKIEEKAEEKKEEEPRDVMSYDELEYMRREIESG